VTTRGSISSAMTQFFGQADPFLTQRAKLTRVFSDIKGTHYLQSDDFSTELSLEFWYSSFLCYPNTLKVFRRLCFCFELGFLSEECLLIRGRTSVPRIVFFRPVVPSSYSRPGFGPLNHLFRAGSAFKLFEAGLRSLESSFLGRQCLQVIRGRASVP
jgi:hypothetical protein